jgi:hypothetical protein
MPCKECGSLTMARRRIEGPSTLQYVKSQHQTIGVWCFPMEDMDVCTYHAKKAEGHFDRDSEHFRFNVGPHEWTKYESYYTTESPYFSQRPTRGKSRSVLVE